MSDLRRTTICVSFLALVPTCAQELRESHWFVFNLKPPSVMKVDAGKRIVLAKTEIGPKPSHVLLGPENRDLYVLNAGAFDLSGKACEAESTLTIVNTATLEVRKTIPLGWRVHRMSLSGDSRRLVTLSEGRPSGKGRAQEPPVVTVLDTDSNEVIARIPVAHRDSKFRDGKRLTLLHSSDMSRLFVYDFGIKDGKRISVPASVMFLSVAEDATSVVVDFAHAEHITITRDDDSRPFVALSPDEKWLYVVDSGGISDTKESRNGKVYVVDVEAAKVAATYNVGYVPRKPFVDSEGNSVLVMSAGYGGEGAGKLFRFRDKDPPSTIDIGGYPQFVRKVEGLQGLLVVDREVMHFLPCGAMEAPRLILLNKSKLYKGAHHPLTLGGPPGPGMIFLGKHNKLVVGVDQFDEERRKFRPDDKVAIIDLKEGKLEHVIGVGRGGVKFGKFMAKMGLSSGLSMAYGLAGYCATSAPEPHLGYRVFGLRSTDPAMVQLAVSKDNDRVFVLNPDTNDVTVIDPVNGTVLDRVAVGGGMRRLFAASAQLLCLNSDDEVVFLDIKSQKLHSRHKVEIGKILDAGIDPITKDLVVLESHTLRVYDPAEGKQLAAIPGFGEPYLLVCTR